MADNIAVTPGAGATVATDEITIDGVLAHVQRTKPVWGVAGAGVDVSGTDPLPVSIRPIGTSGCSVSRTVSAASTNATSAKASAGQVYGLISVNTNASPRYLKLYNKASAPTVGTDVPFMTIPLPSGGGVAFSIAQGIAMGTGIAYAITTGAADNDTGGVAATEIIVNLIYA